MDNYYHRPGGGDKDIREIKYHLNAPNSISSMVSQTTKKKQDWSVIPAVFDWLF